MPINPNHLPVEHPDFKYKTSNNPYATKIFEQTRGQAFANQETEAHKGQWRTLLQDKLEAPTRELHVEIGCNAGHVVLEWAAQNPKNAYIGIDWKFKHVFRSAEKALKREIKNVLFLRAQAERLEYMFAPGEIDHLYLFFPDPWPKKSQRKNRFITAEQLLRLLPLMKQGGIFHIKTDHAGYFEWIEEAIKEAGQWKTIEKTTDLHAGHPCPAQLQIPEVTLFERLFIKEGVKINSVKLQRT